MDEGLRKRLATSDKECDLSIGTTQNQLSQLVSKLITKKRRSDRQIHSTIEKYQILLVACSRRARFSNPT